MFISIYLYNVQNYLYLCSANCNQRFTQNNFYLLPYVTPFNLHIPIKSNKISIKILFYLYEEFMVLHLFPSTKIKSYRGCFYFVGKGRNAFVIPLYFLTCPYSSYFFPVVYLGMIFFLLPIFGVNTTIV